MLCFRVATLVKYLCRVQPVREVLTWWPDAADGRSTVRCSKRFGIGDSAGFEAWEGWSFGGHPRLVPSYEVDEMCLHRFDGSGWACSRAISRLEMPDFS